MSPKVYKVLEYELYTKLSNIYKARIEEEKLKREELKRKEYGYNEKSIEPENYIEKVTTEHEASDPQKINLQEHKENITTEPNKTDPMELQKLGTDGQQLAKWSCQCMTSVNEPEQQTGGAHTSNYSWSTWENTIEELKQKKFKKRKRL